MLLGRSRTGTSWNQIVIARIRDSDCRILGAVKTPPPKSRDAFRVRSIGQWAVPVGVWLAVAFSLGWYYKFTYYGRAAWPTPTFETCAALVLYYFSAVNGSTAVQAVHRLAAHPLAAWLWPMALTQTARPSLTWAPCAARRPAESSRR